MSERRPQLPTQTQDPSHSPPFAPGITGLRGMLIEERAIPSDGPVPVADSERASLLRPISHDSMRTARSPCLHARRPGQNERRTADFPLLQGRVADALIFAWDELQP